MKQCEDCLKEIEVGNRCSTCRSRKQKKENPIKYYYSQLKSHAKERDIPVKLTIQDFKVFYEQTNYLEIKGRGKGKYHIDRIDVKRGYEPDNIQILEHVDNVYKRHFVDYPKGPF